MNNETADEEAKPERKLGRRARMAAILPAVGQEEVPSADVTPIDRPQYSRAFENFVKNTDDLVGLLAYALYKEAIREEARHGVKLDGSVRNPTPALIKAFRSDAEKRISDTVRRGIEDAAPDIEQSAVSVAITVLGSDIKNHINEKTSFKSSLLVNIIAWLVTLAIATIVIFLFGKPDITGVLVDRMANTPSSSPAAGK